MTYFRDGCVDREFAKLLFYLAETLGTSLTETRVRAYAKLLGDVPLSALRAACERAANEPRDPSRPLFFPSPGQLRGYLTTSPDDAALIAWSTLGRAAADVGAYASLIFDDAATGRALVETFGSWPSFCALDEGPALGLKRQEFLAAYRRAAREIGPSVSTPRRVAGLCELSGHYDATRPIAIARIAPSGAIAWLRDRPSLKEPNRVAELPEARTVEPE